MWREKLLLVGVSAVLAIVAVLAVSVCRADYMDTWQAAAYYQEKRHDLPPGFLSALIEQESNWRPHVVSNKGAVGLAQLLPGTVEMIAPGRYTEHKLFYRGINDSTVARIQARLARKGHYDGVISTLFSTATSRGVRSFQRANGLAVDGIVGPTTWAVLFDGEAYPQTVIEALNDPITNIALAAEYFTWMKRNPKCPASLAALVAAYYSGCGSQIVKYVVQVERRYGRSL